MTDLTTPSTNLLKLKRNADVERFWAEVNAERHFMRASALVAVDLPAATRSPTTGMSSPTTAARSASMST